MDNNQQTLDFEVRKHVSKEILAASAYEIISELERTFLEEVQTEYRLDLRFLLTLGYTFTQRLDEKEFGDFMYIATLVKPEEQNDGS